MNKIKIILGILLFFLGFNFFEHFSHEKTDGFSLERIRFSTASKKANPVSIEPKLAAIFSQPYYYLDCGNQCFVFSSEDGKYVLKFFKYAKPSIPHFLTQIPLLNRLKPFRPHRYHKVFWKQQRDFLAYQLAYDHFREESGLMMVHLDTSEHGFPSITLTDKLHISHQVDLNTTPFVLQKRAIPIYSQLSQWIKTGNTLQAQQGIKNLIHLLKKRISQNLKDDDVHFYSNFGFIGDQAIQVDPGHFTLGSSPCPQEEIKTLSQELLSWCQKNAPSLIPSIEYETLSP